MKINIHQLAKDYLTSDEYKYLLLLEFHPELEGLVVAARAGASVTQDRTTLPDQKNIHEAAINIANTLNFPQSLIFSIENLIQYDAIYGAPSAISVFSEKHQLNRQLTATGQVAKLYPIIEIHKKMRQSDFLKAISKVWAEIESAMKIFEENPSLSLLEHISIKDLESSMRIYRLRKDNEAKQVKKILWDRWRIKTSLDSIHKVNSDMDILLKKLGFTG